VALKLASPRLLHKSDAGALRLDLEGTDEARAAYRDLSASPAADGARVLVERMEPPGVELLIAARADGVVPALVVGLGGVWAEAMDDVAIVPLPADADRVEGAIRSLRGAAALAGGRGQEPVDLRRAAALAADASRVLVDEGLALLELNPVVVHGEGCVVLDALARRTARREAPAALPGAMR
jgi:hypothetical protein